MRAMLPLSLTIATTISRSSLPLNIKEDSICNRLESFQMEMSSANLRCPRLSHYATLFIYDVMFNDYSHASVILFSEDQVFGIIICKIFLVLKNRYLLFKFKRIFIIIILIMICRIQESTLEFYIMDGLQIEF